MMSTGIKKIKKSDIKKKISDDNLDNNTTNSHLLQQGHTQSPELHTTLHRRKS